MTFINSIIARLFDAPATLMRDEAVKAGREFNTPTATPNLLREFAVRDARRA